MSARRKLDELLEELRILTPDAMVRWRILYAIFVLLIDKLKKGLKYERSFVRPWEIFSIVKKRASISNNVRMLIKLGVLDLMEDFRVERPEVQVSDPNGFSILMKEFEIWDQIFILTHEYDLLRPTLQILRERFDELNRLVHGPIPK